MKYSKHPSFFILAYGTAAFGSAAVAAQALSNSGIAGAFAFATSPSGVGSVGGSAVAIEELARAGVLSLTSMASKGMWERSTNLLKADTQKLQGLAPEIKNVYNSIKEAPEYPKDFQSVKNGITKNIVKEKELLEELRKIELGEWKKIYKDGYANGKKVSIHYFESKSGKVFNVKVKDGWSNPSSGR